MEKQKQNEVQKVPENNKENQLQSLQNIAKVFQSGKVSPEQKQSGIDYLIKLAQVESKYENQKENIKNDVKYFLEASMQNRLYKHLGEYNIKKFDVDKNGQIDSKEEQDYGNALREAITQIVLLGGINNFSQIHYDSESKTGFSNADKWLADKAHVGNWILGEKGDKRFAESTLQKLGEISEEELHKMQETKFQPTSKESWKQLGLLLAKEFGDGVEDVLRFLGNIPSGVILLPRYLKYRVDINSSDEVTKTTGEIKIKELTSENTSLVLLDLLGEQGVELIKKLGEMLTSGKQGDIAMMMVTIAGLVALGGGATKLGLNLSRKSSVKSARAAGRTARISGQTTSRATRNSLKTVSGVVGNFAKKAERIDDIIGGAGIGHLTGQFSVKDNIEKSKRAREQSHFEELVAKERKIIDDNIIIASVDKVSQQCSAYKKLLEKHKVIIKERELYFDHSTKVPENLLSNYSEVMESYNELRNQINSIRQNFGLHELSDLSRDAFQPLNFLFSGDDVLFLLEAGKGELLEKLGVFSEKNYIYIEDKYFLTQLKYNAFFKIGEDRIIQNLNFLKKSQILDLVNFPNINFESIFKKLIQKEDFSALMNFLHLEKEFLGKYIKLNSHLFNKFLDSKYGHDVLFRNIHKFDLSEGEKAELLKGVLEKGLLGKYLQSPESLGKIDKESFDIYYTIPDGYQSGDFLVRAETILQNIDKFEDTFFTQSVLEKLSKDYTFKQTIDKLRLTPEQREMYMLGFSHMQDYLKLKNNIHYDKIMYIREKISYKDFNALIHNPELTIKIYDFLQYLEQHVNNTLSFKIITSLLLAEKTESLFDISHLRFIQEHEEKIISLGDIFTYQMIDFYKTADLDALKQFYERVNNQYNVSKYYMYYNAPNIDTIIQKIQQCGENDYKINDLLLSSKDSIELERRLDLVIKHKGFLNELSRHFGENEFINNISSEGKKYIMDSIFSDDGDKILTILSYVNSKQNSVIQNIFLSKLKGEDMGEFEKLMNNLLKSTNPIEDIERFEKVFNQNIDRLQGIDIKIYKSIIENTGLNADNFLKIIDLINRINSSKSVEVSQLTNAILTNILDHPHPEKALEAIEKVFIRNGIPMVGKLYRVFEQLYSDAKMEELITQNLSPVLVTKTSNNVRRFTMYRDLLKSHLLSGEATLRNYLETLTSGGELIKKYEKGEKLTQAEQTELLYVLHKLNALGENKNIKLSSLENYAELSQDIENALSQIKTSFGVKENESLLTRVNEMFLKPIGIQSIEQALQIMNTTKKQADSRGRQYFETASKKEDGMYITLPESGDLAKGFESQYLSNIQNDGFVARDFLGTEGTNDLTPFDIDLIKLAENNSLSWLVNNSEASKYGDVIAIIKNKGDITETSLETVGSYDKTKFELFKTGVLGEDHYGIRTALPSTQIDYLIYKGTPGNVESVFFQIAKSGVYTPVVDVNGKIIFTPEMFDFMKQSIFGGIKEWGHEKIDLTPLLSDSKMYDSMISQLPKAQKFQEVASVKNKIIGMLGQALESSGMQLKTTKTDSIHFVEINDTGSTARYTNLDGGYDFDLDLRLNEADYKNVPQIIENIKTLFSPDSVEQTVTKDNLVQYVIKGAFVHGEKMDIDLLFTKYRTGNIIDANQVLKLKLDAVKNQYGEQRYNEVLAQIRLAKTIMKEAEVYKKGHIIGGQGGLGGIGIEAWILNNGGNIQNAFLSFYYSAVQNGELKTFADFKKDYHIYSAGENLRNSQIEDFINNMDENGYKKMIEIVRKYLNN